MRAIAAVGVVAFHVRQQGYGTFGPLSRFVAHLNAGVALFFLLSGFLLYRPFVLARTQGRTVATRSYLVRRFARIVPAYWLALAVLSVWPGLPGFYSGPWLASASFLQIYSSAWSHSGLGVAWSLCTEVSFYLALPLYAWMMDRLAERSGVLASAVAGLSYGLLERPVLRRAHRRRLVSAEGA